MNLAPGSRTGKYLIERQLGAGGMGSVWLARHEHLGSLHAIKVLHDSSPEIDQRLRQEGQLQARLVHPNIVRVTDTVEVQGRPGLVLEYIDGPTLAEMLSRLASSGRTLSMSEIDLLAQGILRGVSAAHDNGWIHRDLKPGNVLIQETDGGLVPKVTDFGLAKVLEGDEQSDVGSTSRRGLGTRRYMPLEQLIGLLPDQRVDVFALGAVLYEIATGLPAFPTVEEWERAIRNCAYPVLQRQDLPERMQAAISASLCERDVRIANARLLYWIWSGRQEELTQFHPETLHAARRSEDHIDPERWLGELTPSERAHLDACSLCKRTRKRSGRNSAAPEAADTWSGDPPAPNLASPHLSEDRLLAEPNADEQAHLASCGRCRSEVRRAKSFADDLGSTALSSGTSREVSGHSQRLSSATDLPVPPARLSRWLLASSLILLLGALGLTSHWLSTDPIPKLAQSEQNEVSPLAAQPQPVQVDAPPPLQPPAPQTDNVAVKTLRPRPSPKPIGQGTLIVSTMGGPSGQFKVDGGPPLAAGPLRKQTLGEGEHQVEVYNASGTLEWEGQLSIVAGKERVFCWNLASHTRCRDLPSNE